MKFILVFSFTFLSACASMTNEDKKTSDAPPADTAAAAMPPATPPESAPMPNGATVAEALKPPPEAAPKTEVAPPAKVVKTKSVDAKQSQRWLQNGNIRFVKGFLRKDGQSKKDIARLSSGQAPHAVVFTCSDSRVPPEIIFDQKLGEIYVVRSASLALEKGVISSIESAVENLGPRFVMVLGHRGCEGTQTPQSVVEELKKISPNLRTAVERGELEIRAAVYDVGTGEVSI